MGKPKKCEVKTSNPNSYSWTEVDNMSVRQALRCFTFLFSCSGVIPLCDGA